MKWRWTVLVVSAVILVVLLVGVGGWYGTSIGVLPLWPHPRGTYQVQQAVQQAQWRPIPMQGMKNDTVSVHPSCRGGYDVDVADYSAVFSLYRISNDTFGIWRTTPEELLLAGVNESRTISEEEMLVLTVVYRPASWLPTSSFTLWFRRVPGTDDLFQVAVPPPTYN